MGIVFYFDTVNVLSHKSRYFPRLLLVMMEILRHEEEILVSVCLFSLRSLQKEGVFILLALFFFLFFCGFVFCFIAALWIYFNVLFHVTFTIKI